jgi:carboxylate-amine ligase
MSSPTADALRAVFAAPDPMSSPTADALRAVFAAPDPLTVGLEEEVMVLDPVSLDLAPVAAEVVAAAADPRVTRELPMAQLELVTAPARSVPAAIAELAEARRVAAAAAGRGRARLAAAGVHPFAAAEGALHADGPYAGMEAEYGLVARRQLVFALQVHVAVGDADRTFAVHDALRSFLPELAALAANAPLHGGRDTGLASVRPTISETLPRQGVPPALGGVEGYAEALQWGGRSGALAYPGRWWWELRPHPRHGTLEVRVPDAQATIADAAAVAATVHALVAWLAARAEAGDLPATAPTWRIEENRWSALRHGLGGTMADLESGAVEPTRERVGRLLEALAPVAARLGAAGPLAEAVRLAGAGGAERLRAVAAEHGMRGATAWLADRFSDAPGWGSGA